MTPEEEAYAEALRRIREAQETGADALDGSISFSVCESFSLS